MMTFEGDRDFPQPPLELWSRLNDARFLVQCVPEATVQGTPEKDRAACTVQPGFTFIRGSLEVALEIVEGVEGKSLHLKGTSKGVGTSSEVDTILTFRALETGSRVHWKAEVKKLGGLLKAVPAGLIRGAAHKVIDNVWANAACLLKSV